MTPYMRDKLTGALAAVLAHPSDGKVREVARAMEDAIDEALDRHLSDDPHLDAEDVLET